MYRAPETLYINKSDSYCGHCGKPAMYSELTHDTAFMEGEGCGVTWRFVDSDYIGLGIGKFAAQARPDLIWVGGDDYVYWYDRDNPGD